MKCYVKTCGDNRGGGTQLCDTHSWQYSTSDYLDFDDWILNKNIERNTIIMLPKKNKLGWAIHNMIGHPLMSLLHLVGLEEAGTYVHDRTIPGRPTKKQRNRLGK